VLLAGVLAMGVAGAPALAGNLQEPVQTEANLLKLSGFRGVPFGAKEGTVPGLKYGHIDKGAKLYSRPQERLDFGGARLDKVVYLFKEGGFFGGFMMVYPSKIDTDVALLRLIDLFGLHHEVTKMKGGMAYDWYGRYTAISFVTGGTEAGANIYFFDRSMLRLNPQEIPTSDDVGEAGETL
jgi:hypothetical protein